MELGVSSHQHTRLYTQCCAFFIVLMPNQCLAEFLSEIFSSFFVFHLHDIIIVTCSPNSDKQFIFDNSPQKWIQFILIAILSFKWLRSWECDIYVYSKTILLMVLCMFVFHNSQIQWQNYGISSKFASNFWGTPNLLHVWHSDRKFSDNMLIYATAAFLNICICWNIYTQRTAHNSNIVFG